MYVGLNIHRNRALLQWLMRKALQQCVVHNKDRELEKFLEAFPANTKFAHAVFGIRFHRVEGVPALPWPVYGRPMVGNLMRIVCSTNE
jgi:hypothetical protein